MNTLNEGLNSIQVKSEGYEAKRDANGVQSAPS